MGTNGQNGYKGAGRMNDKDREIWVGENRLYLGEDNIVYVTVVGDQDEVTAAAIMKAIETLMNLVEGKVNILIDLNQVGQPSPEAREIGQEAFEDEKFGKIALFGLHPVARVIASFVMGVTRKKDIRFFKTNEEALAWLKGEVS